MSKIYFFDDPNELYVPITFTDYYDALAEMISIYQEDRFDQRIVALADDFGEITRIVYHHAGSTIMLSLYESMLVQYDSEIRRAVIVGFDPVNGNIKVEDINLHHSIFVRWVPIECIRYI